MNISADGKLTGYAADLQFARPGEPDSTFGFSVTLPARLSVRMEQLELASVTDRSPSQISNWLMRAAKESPFTTHLRENRPIPALLITRVKTPV